MHRQAKVELARSFAAAHSIIRLLAITALVLPLQVMKGEPVSLSADVFSYGMLLYEIFTHKLPFADTITDLVVSSKIMSGEVRTAPTHAVKCTFCIIIS